MIRNIVRLHTTILSAATLFLLIAPARVLHAFGVTEASFPVLALMRIFAGLFVVLAVAVIPVPNLPAPFRRQALLGLAVAYAFLAILAIAQQVAIWSSLAGALLSAECVLHAAAFGWLANREHASSPLATDTQRS